MMRLIHREAGFSLVEVLIAVAAFSIAVVPLLYVAAGGQRLARSQPEASDLQQRVRVAADKLRRDLAMAGAGPLHGSPAAEHPLSAYIPAIVPARMGVRSPDAPGTAFPDRVCVIYVPEDGWHASLATSMPSASAPLAIDRTVPGCGSAGQCGFTEGMRTLIVDARIPGAGYDVFTVTGVAGALAHDSPNAPFSKAYDAGAVLMPIAQRVYHFDRANRRLMVYDGYLSDMPLVDNVIDVTFSYFGESEAPDGQSHLRPMPLEQFADGPFVGLGSNRFDADLRRIRVVRATLRLQAPADDVRGTGQWFSRPGRSTSGYSYVPDYEVSLDVAPRNLVVVR
jgi:prepilin-type N-terminal cleavage/methylation domain-containing protein